MHFELVSPEKLEYAVEAEMVVVPGSEGDMGILNNHSPLISSLRPGMVEIHVANLEKPLRRVITGGFVEVTDSRCVVLAEEISDPDNLSRPEIEAQLEEARKVLSTASIDRESSEAIRRVEKCEALLLALDK